MGNPTILNIKRHAGIAGQYSLSAVVQYDGEPAETVEFVGSVYGPPIVMVTPAGHQVYVSDSVISRIGSRLTPEWVRAFFGEGDES